MQMFSNAKIHQSLFFFVCELTLPKLLNTVRRRVGGVSHSPLRVLAMTHFDAVDTIMLRAKGFCAT
jgi:hypothetical protein